ncbi:RNA recognition motif-containing protein [Myotisia sp. PD_48]|nr:RNA recognition motif-containing protein [Myotisia sp. PD_48]
MPENNKRRRLSAGESVKAKEEPQKDTMETEDTVVHDRETPQKARHARTLFVRSLPTTATTEKITEHFSQSYPLKHATIVLDPQTKQSKGYGFVTFTDHEDAKRALEEFNGSLFEGKKLKVELAEPRHREIDDAAGKSVASASSRVKELRERRKKDAVPPKLIIRNLPWSVTEPEHLSVLFRSYGKVKHATLPKKGSRLAGFGFIVMRGKQNAERAIQGVNGKELDGRTLAVDWAVDKEEWDTINKPTAETEDDQTELKDEPLKPGKEQEDAGDEEDDNIDDDDDDDDEDDGGVEVGDQDEDDDEDVSMGEDEDVEDKRNETTVFIRNLPFSATDETLYEHFVQFGPLRYARVVLDQETDRPRGTAFVCFWKPDDAIACLRGSPKSSGSLQNKDFKQKSVTRQKQSVLEDENVDPSGKYTMEGRVLQLSQAVTRQQAGKLEAEGTSRRLARDNDRRRLFLLSEGTIPSNSPMYKKLSATEIKMREASAKQRQKLVKSNPMLHISLTRLSVRNIPRHVDSKALKMLARQAVVGFATDVKNGLREPLSTEELRRSSEAMKEAEQLRKVKGKGIVKQAKIVFEGKDGSKIGEESGAGRSRGYGFVEYTSHRSALMGLRWLNGHAVEASSASAEFPQDKKKRIIVEFALENAQVVNRRSERESNTRRTAESATNTPGGTKFGTKRKRGDNDKPDSGSEQPKDDAGGKDSTEKENSIAKRNRIITRKRMMRRSRKTG